MNPDHPNQAAKLDGTAMIYYTPYRHRVYPSKNAGLPARLRLDFEAILSKTD